MRDWRGIKAAIGDRVFYVRMTPPTGRWHQTLPSLPSAATGDISVSVILPPFHWRSREHPLVAVAGLDMEQRLAAPAAQVLLTARVVWRSDQRLPLTFGKCQAQFSLCRLRQGPGPGRQAVSLRCHEISHQAQQRPGELNNFRVLGPGLRP
jgi:hypothetical protein